MPRVPRPRLPRPRPLTVALLLAVVVAAAVIAFGDRLPEVDLEGAIADLARGIGPWTYLLVGLLAFLETGAFVGLVAPGETAVVLGGAVAGQGEISLTLIIAVTWFAAWAGDSVSFLLGRRLGRSFLLRHGERVKITETRMRAVEDYFDRYGGWTILVGRFIGIVRALAPFTAGSSGMRYRAFVPFSVLGTGIWAIGLLLVGYFASRNLDQVTAVVGRSLLGFSFAVGTLVAIYVGFRYLRVAQNRRRLAAAMERRPYLRPALDLGRRLRPQARFILARLTPGKPGRLGLELTSLLAAASVGLFALIAYAGIVAGDPGPTPGDRQSLDVADALRAGWLVEVAKAVTLLGSRYVVLPVAGLAAIALAWRRRWTELAVLAIGLVAIVALSSEIKELIERPRPPGPLIAVEGFSFPSGHAAYATLWTWLAVTVAVRIAPGLAAAGALVGAGIAITVLVGLSRVYLRVHYLSDVSAGWGLGTSAFALCAAAALVVTHLRDNAKHDAP